MATRPALRASYLRAQRLCVGVPGSFALRFDLGPDSSFGACACSVFETELNLTMSVQNRIPPAHPPTISHHPIPVADHSRHGSMHGGHLYTSVPLGSLLRPQQTQPSGGSAPALCATASQFDALSTVPLPNDTEGSQTFSSGDFFPTTDTLDTLGLDLNELIGAIGLGYSQMIIFVIAGLTKAFDSIEVTFISFLIPLLRCVFDLTNFLSSAVASAVYVGMSLGSLFWAWIADRYGRRPALLGTIICTCLFGLVSAAAPDPITALLLRAGLGFGIGGSLPLSIGLFLEYCPVKRRGFWAIVVTVWQSAGACFGELFAWFTLGNTPSNSAPWRLMLILGTMPGLILVPLMLWMHETPRYLVLSGKHHRALYVLMALARQNGRLEAFHNSLVSQAMSLPDAQEPVGTLAVEEGGGTGTCVQAHSGHTVGEVAINESDHSHGATTHLNGVQEALAEGPVWTSGQPTRSTVPDPSSPALPTGGELPRLWEVDAKSIDLHSVLERFVSLRAGAYARGVGDAGEEPTWSFQPGASSFPGPRTQVSRGVVERLRGCLRRLGGILVPRRAQRFFRVLDPFLIIPSTGARSFSSEGVANRGDASFADADNHELAAPHAYRVSLKLFRQETRGANRRGSVRTLFSPQLRGFTLRLVIYMILFAFSYYILKLSLPVLLGDTANTCPVQFSTSIYIGLVIATAAMAPFSVMGAYLAEMPRLGRRWSAAIVSTLTGLSFGVLAFFVIARSRLPAVYPGYPLLVALTSLSNGLVTAVWSIMQLYMTEAFPTMVRGVGTGFVSFFMRSASILAPLFLGFILDLDLLGELLAMLAASFLIIICVIATLPFETGRMTLKDVSEEVKAD